MFVYLFSYPPPKKMPEVVPVVFYHGTEDWNSPLETRKLIEQAAGGEAGHIPRFKPLFYDLNLIENHRLRGSVQTVVGLVCLKYLRRKFTEEIVRILVEEVRRLPAGSDLAKAIYSALAMVKERREIEEFLERAREMRYTDIEEGVMTFAQEVREEGEKRGLEKGETLGKIKDKQEIVKRLLNRKFGLSEEEAARIDGIEDFEALDAALDEIIDAEDKRNVLKKLGL